MSDEVKVTYHAEQPIRPGKEFKPDLTDRAFVMIELNRRDQESLDVHVVCGGIQWHQINDVLAEAYDWIKDEGTRVWVERETFNGIVDESGL